MIKILDLRQAGGAAAVERLRSDELRAYEEAVRPIVAAVRAEGDRALLRYARQFDGLADQPLRVSAEELEEAGQQLGAEIRQAAETARRNIWQFAKTQLPEERFEEYSPGRMLGWIIRPLEAVGCYVPSGRYPLPSTLLMTVVLAQAAGVPRICVASPRPSREILGCAYLLGVREVYRVGGAQAIAALAYGTETIPRVERVVGPGNAYVAAAKKLVAGDVGIDFIAGPTEIVILAADGDARWIAADLLAQAEHDPAARAILITTSESLAHQVCSELERQLQDLPTAATARASIDSASAIYLVRTMEEGIEICNRLAPEHVSLHDPSWVGKIQNAGCIFLGPGSPEAAGDYAAGPSHVLPTNGAARLRGGLSAADFVKLIAVQQLSPRALQELAPAITTLARAEGLEAHARSIEIRLREVQFVSAISQN
jgi:histidinol dehydrogenase